VAEALRACDRASLIVDGLVVETGTARELARSETARALYFGDLPGIGQDHDGRS
jgi:ABC-type lipopolysaccharide export system ATPase subunit